MELSYTLIIFPCVYMVCRVRHSTTFLVVGVGRWVWLQLFRGRFWHRCPPFLVAQCIGNVVGPNSSAYCFVVTVLWSLAPLYCLKYMRNKKYVNTMYIIRNYYEEPCNELCIGALLSSYFCLLIYWIVQYNFQLWINIIAILSMTFNLPWLRRQGRQIWFVPPTECRPPPRK